MKMPHFIGACRKQLYLRLAVSTTLLWLWPSASLFRANLSPRPPRAHRLLSLRAVRCGRSRCRRMAGRCSPLTRRMGRWKYSILPPECRHSDIGWRWDSSLWPWRREATGKCVFPVTRQARGLLFGRHRGLRIGSAAEFTIAARLQPRLFGHRRNLDADATTLSPRRSDSAFPA
jgi:hypothetical protein